MEFLDYGFGEPKYSVEIKTRLTYAAPFVCECARQQENAKEGKRSSWVLSLYDENGTFIINGSERVVVSQLVRSPGVYFGFTVDTSGKKLYSANIIPNRGAWLEFETDSNDVIWVRIDRTRKLPATVLIRAVGLGTDDDIQQAFNDALRYLARLEKDNTQSEAEAMIEIYKRLRPGDLPQRRAPAACFPRSSTNPSAMIWPV